MSSGSRQTGDESKWRRESDWIAVAPVMAGKYSKSVMLGRMNMRSVVSGFVFAIAATIVLATPTSADEYQACQGSEPQYSLDENIAGCTTIIESGRESQEILYSVYVTRGYAYSGKRQYDLAIADFTRAIQLNSDLASTYVDRGMSYTLNGQYDLAIADYNRAIQLKPDNAFAYSNRGLAYTLKGQDDLAIADFNRAIQLKPDDAFAYGSRSIAYAHLGKCDLAATDAAQALRLDPQSKTKTCSPNAAP